uniref:Uncharacterized protein n=1 Tax=Zonotrichia albicollis TaxID=44394 RepID=A0A8D2MR37_ZONAL
MRLKIILVLIILSIKSSDVPIKEAFAVRAAMKPQYKAEAERAAVATVKTVKPKKE